MVNPFGALSKEGEILDLDDTMVVDDGSKVSGLYPMQLNEALAKVDDNLQPAVKEVIDLANLEVSQSADEDQLVHLSAESKFGKESCS